MHQKELTCESHGDYVATGFVLPFGKSKVIWSKCPGCEQEESANALEDKKIKEAMLRQDTLNRAISSANIPSRFLQKTLENYAVNVDNQQTILNHAKKYVENFDSISKTGENLLFGGFPGTGKTHIAISVAKSIIINGYSALYLQTREALLMLRASWNNKNEESENEVMQKFCSVDFLILDEFGPSSNSEIDRSQIFAIIDGRYRNCKPSAFITNHKKAEIIDFVGERAFRRLTELSAWKVFDWKSFNAAS